MTTGPQNPARHVDFRGTHAVPVQRVADIESCWIGEHEERFKTSGGYKRELPTISSLHARPQCLILCSDLQKRRYDYALLDFDRRRQRTSQREEGGDVDGPPTAGINAQCIEALLRLESALACHDDIDPRIFREWIEEL